MLLRRLPLVEWQRALCNLPGSNIFHSPEMFEVFAQSKGFSPDLWAVADSSGRVLTLLLPVRVTLNPMLSALTTRAVVYGSLLCEESSAGIRALELLLQEYTNAPDGRALFTELRNLGDTSAFRPVLQNFGFDYEEHVNFLINLGQSPEDLMGGIGSRTRKNIRRGLRKDDVDISDVTSLEGLAACYELICLSYEYASVPVPDYSLFEAAFKLLLPREMVRFSLARLDGIPIATSVDLLYKGVMYGWYGGVDRRYTSALPGELITWHILEWGAASERFHTYDFGGAGDPAEDYGVRGFKAKFGGELVSFGRYKRIHSRLRYLIADFGYRLSRGYLYGR